MKHKTKTKYTTGYKLHATSSKGFVILFVVVISSIILAVTLSIANIALKEIKFSTSAKDTNEAFFAADTGAECALFNNKSTSNSFVQTGGSGIVTCLGGTFTLNGAYPSWNFVLSGLGNGEQGCAKVTVNKSAAPTTVVTSKGYNIGDVSCLSSSSNRVERELQLTFIENSPAVPVATSTGAKSPSVNGIYDGQWYSANKGFALDNDYAYIEYSAPYRSIDFKAFGFGIPSGASITGIVVKLSTNNDNMYDVDGSWNVVLNGKGFKSTTIGAGILETTLGAPNDLWGAYSAWTDTDFADATFQVYIEVGDGVQDGIAKLDWVNVMVYYTVF